MHAFTGSIIWGRVTRSCIKLKPGFTRSAIIVAYKYLAKAVALYCRKTFISSIFFAICVESYFNYFPTILLLFTRLSSSIRPAPNLPPTAKPSPNSSTRSKLKSRTFPLYLLLLFLTF